MATKEIEEKGADGSIICCVCNVPLEMITTRFEYLGHELHYKVPRCPVCGQVYLSEDVVNIKVADVEASLEDK